MGERPSRVGRRRPGTGPLTRRPFVELLLGARDGDDRTRASQLGGGLFVLAGVVASASVPFLPAPANRGAFLAVTLLGIVQGVVMLRLPWDRLPRWLPMAFVPVTHLMLGVGVGAYAGVLRHFLVLYVLSFLYLGVTSAPGTVGRWALPAVVSGLLAVAGREPAGTLLDLVVAVLIGAAMGELLAAVNQWHRKANADVQALLVAVTKLTSASAETDAVDLLAELGRALFNADLSIVLLSEQAGGTLFRAAAHRGVEGDLGDVVVDIGSESSVVGIAVRTGQAVFVSDAASSTAPARRLVERFLLASVLCMPVPGEGGHIGALVIGWRSSQRRSDELAEQVIEVLSLQAGQVLERLRQVSTLGTAAGADALTGLVNRRGLRHALDRIPATGGVIFIDLDNFKAVNDLEGHRAGDAVLQAFAELLRASVRGTDCTSRYGGDEFVVVLADGADAPGLVGRLRERWHHHLCGFSAGVALPAQGELPDEVLARADLAAYEDKQLRRTSSPAARA